MENKKELFLRKIFEVGKICSLGSVWASASVCLPSLAPPQLAGLMQLWAHQSILSKGSLGPAWPGRAVSFPFLLIKCICSNSHSLYGIKCMSAKNLHSFDSNTLTFWSDSRRQVFEWVLEKHIYWSCLYLLIVPHKPGLHKARLV